MPHISQIEAMPLPIPAGTLIEVRGGFKPVEDLEIGDLVRTKDNGYQPVRWVAARKLDAAALADDPSLRPIRIRAGALGQTHTGEAKPARDLVVSPQHCVLIDDWRCELLFGEEEVLAPARSLLNDHSITVDHAARDVTYHHFMFDRHEIVYSNGAETESYHPGAGGFEALDRAKREELFRIFPQLEQDSRAYGPQARATLKSHEAEVLMSM